MAKYLITAGVVGLLLGGLSYSQSDTSTSEVLHPQKSFSHAHGTAIDAGDTSKLYIGTHEGLFLLVDEKELYRIGESRDDLMGFTAHPNESNTFFSSGHTAAGNIGFQKTIDGGITWTKLSNGLNGPVDFHSMTVSRANPDIVYGFFRGLQRSNDGGKTWEMTKGAIEPIALSTDPDRENVVFAATQSGVLISEDRGDSWKSLSAQLEGGAVSVFLLLNDKVALTFSEKLAGLAKSLDGGVTWQKTDESFGGDRVLYLASGVNITYALTDTNRIYKSADAGETWSNVR